MLHPCRTCGGSFPLEDMVADRRHPSGSSGYCRPCKRAARRKHYAKHRGRMSARALERRYGVTPADYEAMLAAQGGVCAICEQPESVVQGGKLRRLVVDHDHATGRVRALLCDSCNRALGFARDDAERLRRMAEYVDTHAPTEVDR